MWVLSGNGWEGVGGVNREEGYMEMVGLKLWVIAMDEGEPSLNWN